MGRLPQEVVRAQPGEVMEGRLGPLAGRKLQGGPFGPFTTLGVAPGLGSSWCLMPW